MASYVPYQVPYQNQLQFNLGVPLTTENLNANYHHPSPIVVERVGGQHAIPTKILTQKLQGSPKHSARSAANYSTLSEDKMEVMSQLARRDLKNKAIQQQQMTNNNTSAASSPQRLRTQQHSVAGRARSIHCSRLQTAQQKKTAVRHPLTAKEAEKNRRFGAVQTPPPRKPGSHTRVGNDSALSQSNVSVNTAPESDIFFPVKPSLPGETHSSDEVARLQLEMEGYLRLVETIVDRALDEGNTHFLHPSTRGKQKDGYLAEEEGYDRARARVGEQNTRSVRNLYNLRQKVKQFQRDTAQADFSKPAKKGHMTTQLAVIHRGAAKAVQTFVNQLPYQDLSSGLPTHFHELALLLRQLTGLGNLARPGGQTGPGQAGLLTQVETIEALNAKWCAQLKSMEVKSAAEKRERRPTSSKGWVSDTKVDKEIFLTKDKRGPAVTTFATKGPQKGGSGQQAGLKRRPQPQAKMGRQARRPPGKENRGNLHYTGRREELRSGIAALLQQKESVSDPNTGGGQMSREPPHPVAWEVDIGRRPVRQDHRKGYLLPSDLIAKRERAQRAMEASNQRDWNFADPTLASRLKTSLRPSSAPPSPDKRVNFDLGPKSPTPWMPAGLGRSRSSSRSSGRRSRSLSNERRSPFYLRDLETQDVREVFPDRHNLKKCRKPGTETPPKFGYQSLPTDKKLRSADVSNSFIDEVEHCLLARMMGQNSRDRQRAPLECQPSNGLDLTADTTGDFLSEAGEDTLDSTNPEELVQREAASLLDAPTLENVKLRLREMQREQRDIRQRWSSLKFYDQKEKSKIFSASDILSERPRDPPAIELSKHTQVKQRQSPSWPVSKEVVEVPLIFTKPALETQAVKYMHTVYPGGSSLTGQDNMDQADRDSPLTVASLQRPAKRLLSLKQTTAERIASDRSKFEGYLKRRSHHPSGKFDPWALMDEISDEILLDCLVEVSEEVEGINADIANHMYKSEFLVDHTTGLSSGSGGQIQKANLSKRQSSPQHIHSGGDDAFASRTPLLQERQEVVRLGHGPQSAIGDQHPLSGNQWHPSYTTAHQADQRQAVTPRSSSGQLRSGSPLREPSPKVDGAGQSSPGASGGHLWRSNPGSPASSVGQRVGGSRSVTPRSPQMSVSAAEGGGRSPSPRVTSPAGAGVRASPRGGRRSPQVSASEPLLDDVSHLLRNKDSSGDEEEEDRSRRSQEMGRAAARGYDHGGKEEYDEEDDDEDEDDYSEEDFEDVTDVEL